MFEYDEQLLPVGVTLGIYFLVSVTKVLYLKLSRSNTVPDWFFIVPGIYGLLLSFVQAAAEGGGVVPAIYRGLSYAGAAIFVFQGVKFLRTFKTSGETEG